MKFALLLALAAFSLTACTTDSNRRELYRPKKGGQGAWTESLKTGEWKKRKLVDEQLPEVKVQKRGAPAPAPKVNEAPKPVEPTTPAPAPTDAPPPPL